MRVSKLKQPKLTLSLVAGGSLLPNTTYYFAGFFRMAGYRDNGACSPMSDEYSITTNTSNLSIKIHYYIDGAISGASDNGDGRTKLYAPDHCLGDNKSITISGTTSYNGSWIAEWVDYDYLIIDTPFVADETGTWICEDDDPFQPNTYFAGVLKTTPLKTGGLWDVPFGNYWTHRDYSGGYTTNDPIISSQPTQIEQGNYYYHPELNPDYVRKGLQSANARCFIDLESSGTYTFADVISEMDLAHAEAFYIYTVYNSVEDVSLIAYIYASGASLTANKSKIYLNGKLQSLDSTLIVFNFCTIIIEGIRRSYFGATINTCLIYDWTTDSIQYDDTVINNSTLLQMRNMLMYASTTYPVKGDFEITLVDDYYYFDYVYPKIANGNYVHDIIVNNGYVYHYIGSLVEPHSVEQAILRNITLKQPNYAPPYDIKVFATAETPGGLHFLNIVAEDRLEKKVITHRVSTSYNYNNVYYWYEVVFHVEDEEGNNLVGASISITDGKSNNYTDTTDANGDATIKVIGYANLQNPSDIYGTDDDYGTFEIEVSYTGRQTYKKVVSYIHEKLELTGITLDYAALGVLSLSFTNCSTEASNDGTITVAATGGSGNYNYSKDGGSNWQASGSFTGLALGDYDVMIEDTTTSEEITAGTITLSSPKNYYGDSIDGLIVEDTIDGTINDDIIDGSITEEIINGTVVEEETLDGSIIEETINGTINY